MRILFRLVILVLGVAALTQPIQAREIVRKGDTVVSALSAAAPVLSTGADLPATEKEKTLSYWSALVRNSATRNGHNPDIGEAFMDKEKEVKIGDRVVHPKGTLLTLNAQEATENINGKPLLADGIADSVADLMQKAGLKGA